MNKKLNIGFAVLGTILCLIFLTIASLLTPKHSDAKSMKNGVLLNQQDFSLIAGGDCFADRTEDDLYPSPDGFCLTFSGYSWGWTQTVTAAPGKTPVVTSTPELNDDEVPTPMILTETPPATSTTTATTTPVTPTPIVTDIATDIPIIVTDIVITPETPTNTPEIVTPTPETPTATEPPTATATTDCPGNSGSQDWRDNNPNDCNAGGGND